METKICTKCKTEKVLTEFYKDRSREHIDGTTTRCIRCFEEYREQNRLLLRDTARELRKNHWEEIKTRNRENYRKLNPNRKCFLRIKNRAKIRNIEFSLEESDIIIPEKCPLLDCPFVVGVKGDYGYTPSVDRIDNSKGYIKGNVQVISMKANSMKNNATKEELIKFALNTLKFYKDDDIVRPIWKRIENGDKELH